MAVIAAQIAVETVAVEVNPRADAVAKKVMGGVASNRKPARPPVEKVVEKPAEKPVEQAAPVVERTEPVVERTEPAPEKVAAEPVKPQKRDKPASQPRVKDKAKGADNEGLRELGKSIDWSSAPETDMARALREALTGKKNAED